MTSREAVAAVATRMKRIMKIISSLSLAVVCVCAGFSLSFSPPRLNQSNSFRVRLRVSRDSGFCFPLCVASLMLISGAPRASSGLSYSGYRPCVACVCGL